MEAQVARPRADGIRDQATPERGMVARLRAKPKSIEAVASPEDARRETNGITSRLVLLYLEQVGGEAAVDKVLERCDMSDRREQLMDENYWFSYRGKIALF